MFLYDALQHFRGAGVIPNAFGIDDGDRALCADTKAIGFGAIDEWFWADKVEFFEAAL
jgi:hypothetical protein